MMKWEYMRRRMDVAEELPPKEEVRNSMWNSLGSQGWELVSVYQDQNNGIVFGFFKRAIEN